MEQLVLSTKSVQVILNGRTINPHVRLFVGWLVGWMICPKNFHNFPAEKLHVHALIGMLSYYDVIVFYYTNELTINKLICIYVSNDTNLIFSFLII